MKNRQSATPRQIEKPAYIATDTPKSRPNPLGTPVAKHGCMTSHRQDLKARALTLAERALPLHPRLTRQGPAHAHMAQQMWEAVSSIGAQLEEGEVANSRRDMAAKHAIALREAREARYWFRLIASDPAWSTEVRWFIQESEEFVRMLTVSVRRLRSPPA